MKKTKLEHSFDDIKLSDVDKKEILDQLKNKSQKKLRQSPLRPVLALALIALLIAGTYFGGKYINPRQIAGTVPTTSAQTDTATKLLFTTPYSVLSKLYTSEEFPVSPDQWTEIAKILNQAVPDPLTTAITMELRANDLEFVGDVMQGVYTIMIRDFREVYQMGSGSFSAYHLEEEDSKALKTLLTEVLNGNPLSKSPISGSYTTLRKLTSQTDYPVTNQEWTDLSRILDQLVADPAINAVTDDLRTDDLELIGKTGDRIFIRDFQEVYLTTLSGTFSAFHLEAQQSLELKALLTKILNKEPDSVIQIIRNILEAEPAAQTIRRNPDQPISAYYQGFDTAGLKSLLSAKFTGIGKVESLPPGIIFLEAVGNGFGVSDGILYVRSGYEITSYNVEFSDRITLETIQTELSAQYDNLVNLEKANQAVSPQELAYTEFQGPSDLKPIPLSAADWENIYTIFKSSHYIDTLKPFDQGQTETIKFATSVPGTMTLATSAGDLYVTRKSTISTENNIYHFRLAPDMALKLDDLLQLIRESK